MPEQAPAPAPQSAQTPPQPTIPAPQQTPTPPQTANDPFGKLDAAVKTPKPKPEAKPKEEKAPKEVKADKQPVPTEKAKAEPEAQHKEPKQLREELDRVKSELSAKANKVAVLESAMKEHEARGKDTTLLAEKLAKAEKEQAELRAQLRANKFEASDQFKGQYD